MTINNYWNTGEHVEPERIDHAAEAVQHIEWAHEQQELDGDMGNVPRDNALLAQVHATLALVEQQRIANLIATGEHTALFGNGRVLEKVLSADVREGLRL